MKSPMTDTYKATGSIITRLTLVVTGILIMAAVAAGCLALIGQQRQLKLALGTKAATLVQFMAQVSPLDVLSLNFVVLNNDVKKVVQTDNEAVYAVILNGQGVPLVYFFKEADPLVTGEVRRQLKNRDPLAAIEAMKHTDRILEVTAPINAGERQIGTAALGFSYDKMLHALMNQILVIGVVLILIIGLSITLLRFILRRTLSPVQALTAAAGQISAGDLNIILPIADRSDELGVLSRAFESMAGRLRGMIAGLERQLSFVKTMLQTIPVAVFYKDAEGRYLGCNEAFTEITGVTKEKIAGKTVYELWPGELSETYHQQDLELMKNPAIQIYDFKIRNKAGELVDVVYHKNVFFDEFGNVAGIIGAFLDITERKANLRYFEAMDQINRAIQGADNLERMMNDVLDVALSVFACDRAYLVYPCDPDAAFYFVPMERTKPEYPGALDRGVKVPLDEEGIRVFRTVMESDNPVTFGPGSIAELPSHLSKYFGVQSQAAMAVYPKNDKPYMFGLHQCSHPRIWTEEEMKLLREIGRRLTDALSGLLAHRDLQESEARYRLVFENSPVSIWEEDFSGVKAFLETLSQNGITDIEMYFQVHPEAVRQCAQLAKIADVNEAALKLHGAKSKEELFEGLVNTFTPESFDTFRKELVCLWNGVSSMVCDGLVKTLSGEPRHVTVYFSVCPGYEKSLSKVVVSLVDITARKLAEDSLRRLSDELETRVKERTEELEAKVAEIERMNKIFVGRELKMVELKERIRRLEDGSQQEDEA